MGAPAVPAAAQAQPAGDFVPVTDAMLQDPAPGDWLMWRRTLDGWGYSPLDRIDRDNVGELRMVWTRALGAGSQQGTPLAYGGVLYMPNPRDVIQAIDAVTGDLLWEYRRARPDDLDDHVAAGLSEAKRNIAIYGDLIVSTSADDHAYALDAATGRRRSSVAGGEWAKSAPDRVVGLLPAYAGRFIEERTNDDDERDPQQPRPRVLRLLLSRGARSLALAAASASPTPGRVTRSPTATSAGGSPPCSRRGSGCDDTGPMSDNESATHSRSREGARAAGVMKGNCQWGGNGTPDSLWEAGNTLCPICLLDFSKDDAKDGRASH